MKNNSINNDSYKQIIDRCENKPTSYNFRDFKAGPQCNLFDIVDIDKNKNYLSILKTKEINDDAIKEFLSDLYKKLVEEKSISSISQATLINK